MSDSAKWYVIHTYSGYENKVMTNLETIVENRKLHDLILDVKVPTETVVEIKDNKTKEIERKIFPGYVLVKMILTDDTWYVIRNIRGVTGFVGTHQKPVPLTEEEAEKLGVEKRVIEVNYTVGDSVKILEGPFTGHTGIVDELDVDKNSATVIVVMFGRETPIEFELDQIEVVKE